MEKEESCLEDFKKNYSKIQQKHGLPEFDDLNCEFSIEKLTEVESDFLIREIRKFLSDKLSNYLRFIEAIIHPVNSPMFVFAMIKVMGEGDKEKLTEVYKKLAKHEVEFVQLDLNFDEEKEAKFIKDSYNLWKEIKKEIGEVIDLVLKNWDNKFETNNKGYFG
jgi:hypothetical protein